MGTEAIWVPLVLGAVSAGTQYMNNRQQARRADRVALDSLRTNAQRQRRADEVTQKLISETGKSTDKEERSSTMSGFLKQLQKAQVDSHAGLQIQGAANDAFARDAAQAALGIDAEGTKYADLASRLDSPFLQRRNEQRLRTDAALDIDLVGREQQGADRTSDLRLRAIRSNPWLDAMSAVTRGAAASYGSGWGAGTGQPATAFGARTY